MELKEIMGFLMEKAELFKEVDSSSMSDLVRGSRVANYEPNEAIIEFGEENRYLGVLLRGKAELSITDDTGERHVLRQIDPGDLFGVVSLMTGEKTTADVTALERCTALLIPQNLFTNIVTASRSAIELMSRLLVERLRRAAMEGRSSLERTALQSSPDPYGFRLRSERPQKILVLNCGSSSLKYNYFNTADEEIRASGSIERIGEEGTLHKYRSSMGDIQRPLPKGGHADAFEDMIAALTSPETGVIASTAEITAVGHRVVHGGQKYNHAVLINDEVEDAIEKLSRFAPLHNPLNLLGIRSIRGYFPHCHQVAVFDTAFHQTMPAYAYLYGLPYEYYEEKGIRRYGFHGTSHKYVSLKIAEFMKRPYNELRTIICHLGNGASVCAVDHGRSVDTSMGFTPAEGLIMGARCGDLDPAILTHLMDKEGLDHKALNWLINKGGGLKGLSGISNDMREIEAAASRGEQRALLAIRAFCYRLRKYIGAYVAAMGGLDAIAFTGGIGQGSVGTRSLACQGLGIMGILVDEEKNRMAQGIEQTVDITAGDGPVRVLVVPTDEERMIARETLRVLDRAHVSGIIKSHEPFPIPVEISAHNVHLSQEHVEILFGPGYQLTPMQDLSQPGQFACQESVHLIGPKGSIRNVRVLGPTRKETQVEISMSEQFKLGIDAPVRESGMIDGTPGVTLAGPKGRVHLEKGVICPLRHIHMEPGDALKLGLRDKDVVRVRVPGDRETIFGDVLVRAGTNYRLAFHLDTDEGNAANVKTGAVGYIDGIQSRR